MFKNSNYEWKSAISDTCEEMLKRTPEYKGHIKLYGLLGSIFVDILNPDKKENVNEKEDVKENNVDIEKEQECVICLQKMNIKISLPCGHVKFHKKCISNKSITTCPICRTPFNKIINLYT
jgi:hypothetical protein